VAVSAALALGACSADPGPGGGGTTVASPATGGTAPGTGVPIVDPADAEAFCALDQQLDQLTAEQLGDADPDDAEAFRQDMAAFLTDNAAVLDQYVAAAPAEIRTDVVASMDQTRAAVDDPEGFAEALTRNGSSDRVSAFVDRNCP
jgi:hypothetical protein